MGLLGCLFALARGFMFHLFEFVVDRSNFGADSFCEGCKWNAVKWVPARLLCALSLHDAGVRGLRAARQAEVGAQMDGEALQGVAHTKRSELP